MARKKKSGRRRPSTSKSRISGRTKKRRKPKPLNRSNPIKSMAKKRRSAPRRFLRRVRGRRGQKRFNLINEAIPIAGVAFAEPFLNTTLRPIVGRFAPGLPVTELAEVGLGAFMAKKGGMTGRAGRALFTIALARTVQSFASGLTAPAAGGNGGASF